MFVVIQGQATRMGSVIPFYVEPNSVAMVASFDGTNAEIMFKGGGLVRTAMTTEDVVKILNEASDPTFRDFGVPLTRQDSDIGYDNEQLSMLDEEDPEDDGGNGIE